jgi:hypothetical protein
MSWQIPTQIEQDIIAGKATYRTFQTGNGGQSILPVPANAYVVIFGYDFSPAGGGFKKFQLQNPTAGSILNDKNIRWFETQQISFYTGTDFYPFIHHVDIKTQFAPYTWNTSVPEVNEVLSYQTIEEIDNTPIARQLYITSSNDVTITHGLILNAANVTSGVIPVTSRTPNGLTYGGSGQSIQAQTNYGPGATPLQFMQPSPKDFQDFALGLLPANADGQAFATPNNINGLYAANLQLFDNGGNNLVQTAAANYYLCLHYALYNKPIPEKQG